MNNPVITKSQFLNEEEINTLFKMKGYFRNAIQFRNAIKQDRMQKSSSEANEFLHQNKFKKVDPFASYSAGTQNLIEQVGKDIYEHSPSLVEMQSDAFSTTATKENMREYALQNPEICKQMLNHVEQIEKNKKIAERWHSFAVMPLSTITKGLDIVERELHIPPIRWILPLLKNGFEHLSVLAELRAMKYDPDLKGPQAIHMRGAATNVIGTLAAIGGTVALALGGAATGIALAPITFFIGAAAALANNIVTAYTSTKAFINEYRKKEPESSFFYRKLAHGFKAFTAVNGAFFTGLAAALAFAAISNPIGLAVAATALVGYIAATASLGLISYITSKWANKKAKQAEEKSAQVTKPKNENETPTSDLEDKMKLQHKTEHRFSESLKDVERAYASKDENAEPETGYPRTYTPGETALAEQHDPFIPPSKDVLKKQEGVKNEDQTESEIKEKGEKPQSNQPH